MDQFLGAVPQNWNNNLADTKCGLSIDHLTKASLRVVMHSAPPGSPHPLQSLTWLTPFTKQTKERDTDKVGN